MPFKNQTYTSIQKLIKTTVQSTKVFVSYEITTNIQNEDIRNKSLNNGIFISVVWSGKFAKFKLLESDTLLTELFDLLKLLNEMKIHTMLHLSCYEMSSEKLNYILQKIRNFAITDVLIVRGG